MDRVRGPRIAMVFQEAHSRLNPVFSVGGQIAEVFQVHEGLSPRLARARAVGLLDRVGMPAPRSQYHAYPHELSGGQAQRVMIALALALDPELIIADEPTTALDVTVQAQILSLIDDLRARRGTAWILITHDLGVIAERAQRVAVMYAGQIVEQAPVGRLFKDPLHPYAQGLLDSMPQSEASGDRLKVIPGSAPDPADFPPGCRFAPRCEAQQAYGLEICDRQEPELNEVPGARSVRCWLYGAAPGHIPPLDPSRTPRRR
jgi:oligopeptide/dipeptide ABC transporter ATP-binding protein